MTVFLVGAGPGDPGLITRRGAELLGQADVVVHDRLSAVELLDLAPEAAERIDVGKAPGRARLTQEEINALLVERGRAGQDVVRLKGGDPFVFARGGEEAAALAAAGVAFEVVPGITSALAVPAAAGIPVTLRYSSTSFTVVTGHEDPASGTAVDWDAIAAVGGTIVVLMGVGRWEEIATRLIDAGLPADTPAAAVRWGTRPEQQVTRATLATLDARALAAPSVIVVGAVAAEELLDVAHRPLLGRRVVVTRSRAQASALVDRLRALGAATVELPAIETVDPADGGAALGAALARVHTYDWLVLTSPNGVERTIAAIDDLRTLAGVRIAVVGTGTAEALAAHHVRADLVPARFVAESLVDGFPAPPDARAASHASATGRVLVAQAAGARDVVTTGLRAKGWEVDAVEAYRTEPTRPTAAALAAVDGADAITFTSSSTVGGFCDAAGVERVPPVVATIGPITSSAARDRGIDVTVEAAEHSIDGLVAALVDVLAPGWHAPEIGP